MFLHPAVSGEVAPGRRTDQVFFETPNGGAVFSTSSIARSASLLTYSYENNVAQMTRNVVGRFADAEPFGEGWMD